MSAFIRGEGSEEELAEDKEECSEGSRETQKRASAVCSWRSPLLRSRGERLKTKAWSWKIIETASVVWLAPKLDPIGLRSVLVSFGCHNKYHMFKEQKFISS